VENPHRFTPQIHAAQLSQARDLFFVSLFEVKGRYDRLSKVIICGKQEFFIFRFLQ
jgi:hypothetical protein